MTPKSMQFRLNKSTNWRHQCCNISPTRILGLSNFLWYDFSRIIMLKNREIVYLQSDFRVNISCLDGQNVIVFLAYFLSQIHIEWESIFAASPRLEKSYSRKRSLWNKRLWDCNEYKHRFPSAILIYMSLGSFKT